MRTNVHLSFGLTVARLTFREHPRRALRSECEHESIVNDPADRVTLCVTRGVDRVSFQYFSRLCVCESRPESGRAESRRTCAEEPRTRVSATFFARFSRNPRKFKRKITSLRLELLLISLFFSYQ